MLITPPKGVDFEKCSLWGCFGLLWPISRGLSAAEKPLLLDPTIIFLPDPDSALLANVLHRLGLDVVTTVGQIFPTSGPDGDDGLTWGCVFEAWWWRRRSSLELRRWRRDGFWLWLDLCRRRSLE